MADDTNFRSYRASDQRRPAQATPTASGRQGGNDPLAELARLIGQSDPFADLKQDAPRAGTPAPSRRPVATPSVPSDPYGSPLQFSSQQFDNRGDVEPQHESFQPAYDPAIYGKQDQQQPAGHASDAYYDDPSRTPQGEEAYEEDYAEERPRHGMMKLVAVLAGLAVIGAGGALGYRTIFGGSASGPPPVIKANTAPSKIVPAPAAEASNKQIYDRVGDASQGERVVSREEKPIEVKVDTRQAARAVFPGAGASSNAQDAAMATASPPLNTDPGGPSSAEPKKIRTVTIRPDGTGSTPAPRPAAASPAERIASAAPVPAAAPARPATEPNAAAKPNGPLSLSPQVANAEASARPAFPTPPKPATAAVAAPTRVAAVPPAAAEVASGGYTVQISSQRSETEAQASFRSLQTKFPSLLSDRQPIIRRADLGDKGIYFRAMVGPFASGEQAVQFCGSLKSAGGQCVVQRN